MTPLFGFYDDLERYSSTVNSNFVLNIPYTLLREIFIKWETEQKKYILPKEENKMSFGEVSAVEWLIKEIQSFGIDTKFLNGTIEQAKEMEKNSYICSKCKSQINGNEVMQQMQGSEKSD